MDDLKPYFGDVQSHYDLSDQFYRLFLDPTRTYSCAYFERYDHFFEMAHNVLPDDGVMLLHTITRLTLAELTEQGIPLTMDAARFASFIGKEIFPGGQLPAIEAVRNHAAAAGFAFTRAQSLQLHYARTLNTWAEALQAKGDEAISIQSEEVYDRYMKYLTGCADMFQKRYIDVDQFTLEKQ